MRRTLFAFLPLLAGCYTYAPIASTELQPGIGVRARVNAATAEALQPLLGTADARVLTGVIITASPDTLLIEVPTTTRAEIGNSLQTLNQRVAVPRVSIFQLDTRRIDRLRTGLVVGSASLLAGTLIFKIATSGPGDDRPPGGGELPEFRFSLLRIRM
jgi:hypothetical protein